ncbi:MAG: helix-turn-helix domain-containing protein [Lachnospiraceae bacterium]|nr:helix-turn-helix domain-containing protein [Lachnospiraceae bacterium]
MATTYEISKFESSMPIRCYIHHIGHIKKHSHELFEILFVLSGECSLIMDNHLYHLKENDVFIIEDFLPHELHSENCVYATIQLDRTLLEKNFVNPIHPTFSCNSQIPGKEAAYDALRKKIAFIIKNNADKPFGYELKNWIYIYELMDILFLNFRVEKSAAYEKKNHRYAERVLEISKIIKEHYTEDLTLSSLADMMHLSVPYLSKFFMEHFGVNYLTYLTQLRTNRAEYELVHTEKTIETIARDCGFPNSNAFTSAFKKEYNALPSAYRRSAKAQPVAASPIEYHDYMTSLRKYLTAAESTPTPLPLVYKNGQFSAASSTHDLLHTWRNVISIGQASDLLFADVQEMLSSAQKRLHFEYIFFNGILSDNLYLYQRNVVGESIYNFAYVDRIFDFLKSINLKPMLSFSYMPRDLASNSDHYVFGHLTSEPDNLDLWCNLIDKFMEHICARYGIHEIQTWRFSVWHQPNTPSRLFGFSNKQNFYVFYQRTRAIVKSFSDDLIFGLPCMYFLEEEYDTHFIDEMISWCREQHCIPDFFNFSFYDTTLDHSRNKSKDSFGFVDSMTLNSSSDGLKKAITYIKKIQRDLSLESLPVYICEWNNTPSQQDYLNDTCFKSCYIVKNILENYDRIDALSYWSLTDLMSEHALPDNLYFGGLGLFTKNGIPKASFYAMCLLKQLGDKFLAKGDCWFATQTDNDIRILVYYYKHFTNLYASGERFDMTATDRYTMFESSNDLKLNLEISDVENRSYQVKEYSINRNYGSTFDTWVEFGCIDPEDESEISYLVNRSLPRLHKYTTSVTDNILSLDVILKVLEVRLIIIK